MEGLKEMVSSSDNLNVTIELRGWSDNQKILDFYKNNLVNVFINLSSSEGVPVSIMEAMSFGIPILATDVGGTSEVVENNKNGFLLDIETPLDEVARVLKLFFNKDTSEKFSAGSKEIFSKKCKSNTNFKQFANKLLHLNE